MQDRPISIHALLAESDGFRYFYIIKITQFLSTLSLRRATFSVFASPFSIFYFYPRSPCGERHPPSITPTASRNFYPRSPCGERLARCRFWALSNAISIHALLAESDIRKGTASRINGNFYPRSPCGERHEPPTSNTATTKFLSTLSLRRATGNKSCKGSNDSNFYPRSPCGERRPEYFLA